MKNQPSSAIENGLTAQFTNTVTPMPRQCCVTWRMAPKSIFSSMGMIINQTSTATGRLTFAISAVASVAKRPGKTYPSPVPTRMHRATHSVRYRSKNPMRLDSETGDAGLATRLTGEPLS